MRYHSSMNKKLRSIVLEWGAAHKLLDALGVGKHGASLPARLQQLMRQAIRLDLNPTTPPEGVVQFELDVDPPPARKSKKKRR
jgi:hypothetical protein